MMGVLHGIIQQEIFSTSVWLRRKELLYVNGSVDVVNQNSPTSECNVNGTECYDS